MHPQCCRPVNWKRSSPLPGYRPAASSVHYTKWFKYDRDIWGLFTHKSVRVIFEPPCIYQSRWQCKFSKFDIQMSVHRKYNSKLQPTRCNVSWFIYFYRRSTCFRRLLRSSSGAPNCTYSYRYCQPILLPAAIVDEMEHEFQSSTIAAGSSSIGWQYLKLYVQLCAPDDGQRNRLKHVERL